jgi:DNA-binding NtrC family response regulator
MPAEKHVFLGMTAIIASESMRSLMALAERAARSQATILITGESGTGKELIARAIHQLSLRSNRPWVDLSCAVLPEHLIESELFGHEKGAFSGADTSKPGLFEMAHSGTIFLDEIGELDGRMQVKLLRVLDGVPYYRLGGVRKVPIDARVVAATNRDLETAVAEGKFRADLYHRLQQFVLRVPPLRERVEDIAPLARHFLAEQNPQMAFTERAVAALESRWWLGNIRELRNTVIQASLLAKSEWIEPEDIAPSSLMALSHATLMNGPAGTMNGPAGAMNGPAGTGSSGPPAAGLEGMERRAIQAALVATGGHQARAAAQLGISRRTLSRKLKMWEETGVGAAS